MGEKRLKMFELKVEGEYSQTLKYIRRLKRRIVKRTKIEKLLWFENRNKNNNVFCYEFCIDIPDTLKVNSEVLQKEIENCLSNDGFKTATIISFNWVNEEMARFSD